MKAPKFTIKIDQIDDDPNEPAVDFVVIDAWQEGSSCGYICLDSPVFLWALRDAISKFIVYNHIPIFDAKRYE